MSTRFSQFGERFRRPTGALELMSDLGEATSGKRKYLMLGGGNPARIPEMEQIFRREMARIVREPEEFARLSGFYSAPDGDIRFRSAVADFLRRTYDWNLTAANIALTSGSQSAFFMLFNLLAGKGSDPKGSDPIRRILFPLTPEYLGYGDVGVVDHLFTSQRPVIQELPNRMFKYGVDFPALKVDDSIAAICVSRPTNPTGNVLTQTEMNRLDELARKAGVPLILDCAYGPPFPDIQFVGGPPLWNDNTILCLSLSKIGLPAVRTGIVIAKPEIVQAMAAMQSVMSLAPPSVGAVLAHSMMADGTILQYSREIVRPYYESRAKQAVAWINEFFDGLQMRIHEPEGAFFLWLWFPGLPITSAELYKRLKQRGVLVLSGHYFFPGLEGDWRHRNECLRVNYSQDPDTVREGLRQIAREVRQAHG
ncbi:MAG TPA: valine--pyruvate transaminase [Steroidobacteraceae bacterium]|nr:valine--pyruvate transaminase [Steroidobacteraceae bacterium]